jgi:Abortive infection C-terminus
MADLTNAEKRKLELVLDMGGGWVLDFTNRTFAEFVEDHVARNIFDEIYSYASNSKANRLRRFFVVESNYVVGTLLRALLVYGRETSRLKETQALAEECDNLATRLLQTTPVPDLDALAAITDERDFEAVARQIREIIEKNRPEDGLDRLHTFTIKFVRGLCQAHGISVTMEKPLHSLFGEYVKKLKDEGHLESMMTERILRTSISNLDSFNDVRNNQSLAHDNTILNYDESLLIFNHVAAAVRFLKSLEYRIQGATKQQTASEDSSDDIPF